MLTQTVKCPARLKDLNKSLATYSHKARGCTYMLLITHTILIRLIALLMYLHYKGDLTNRTIIIYI